MPNSVRNKLGKRVIVSDMDGIVSDFFWNATALLKEMFGKPETQMHDNESTGWGFEQCGFVNDAEQIEEQFWERVRQTENYWYNQPELYPGIVQRFNQYNKGRDNVYFCTTRQDTGSTSAELQSWRWLQSHGMIHPNVCVTKEKGLFCASVAADYFIDDKPENIMNVLRDSPNTKCFYLSYYPQPEKTKAILDGGGNLIVNVEAFFGVLEHGFPGV